MRQWVLLSGFAVIVHMLIFVNGPTLPAIFQVKSATAPTVHLIWVTHIKDASIEIPKAENPLEYAQAITEDLLKETLK